MVRVGAATNTSVRNVVIEEWLWLIQLCFAPRKTPNQIVMENRNDYLALGQVSPHIQRKFLPQL